MRTILHIDMNSYFATVEQQANPKLRGKPVAVLGSKAKRSIIVAASVEAKKFGVKTGTRVEEAPILCPDIIFVHGEPRKYSFVTKKFIEIVEDYTDKVEIFSIDECFLDVTATVKFFDKEKSKNEKVKKSRHSEAGPTNLDLDPYNFAKATMHKSCSQDDNLVGAVYIANEIKRRIKEDIGGYITCSVGISHNKFLAKTGSDLIKPDGLVVIVENPKSAAIPVIDSEMSPVAQTRRAKAGIQEECVSGLDSSLRWNDEKKGTRYLTVDEVLIGLPLFEFCGIGKRTCQRLGSLGIETTQQLRDYPNVLLNREFGIATGEKLKRMAYGIDNSPVINWHDRADAKSYSHARTLNKNITDREDIKKHMLLLSEKIGSIMRKDGCMAREVGVWIRYGDFGGDGQRHRGTKWTHDGLEIYGLACKILAKTKLRAPVRAIGVYVAQVQKENNVSKSLLSEDDTNDKILAAMDAVNNRFGETVVTRARLAGTKIKEVVSGLGRDKF